MRKPQINISLSRQPKTGMDDTIIESVNSVDWERIAKIAQETAKTLAIVGVAAYSVKKAIDTTSEIAIIAAHHQICH